jgi:hypothetical protein
MDFNDSRDARGADAIPRRAMTDHAAQGEALYAKATKKLNVRRARPRADAPSPRAPSSRAQDRDDRPRCRPPRSTPTPTPERRDD